MKTIICALALLITLDTQAKPTPTPTPLTIEEKRVLFEAALLKAVTRSPTLAQQKMKLWLDRGFPISQATKDAVNKAIPSPTPTPGRPTPTPSDPNLDL